MPRSPRALPRRQSLVLLTGSLLATLALTWVALRPPRIAHAEPPAPGPAPTASAPPAIDAAPSASTPPLVPIAKTHVTLTDDQQRAIEVYPPVDGPAKAPLVVFLHATCMDPRPVCDFLGNAGREGSFLVCPSGNATCYGAPDWHGPGAVKSAFLSSDLAKVEQRFGAQIVHDDTLIGWSRGAFAARDILYDDVASGRAPRFSSLVLIAADVRPDPAKLRAAGIRRVLLTSGDKDGARIAMQRATEKIAAAGISAHFLSLGPVGHWLPNDFEARLAPGIAWVRGK
jgi:predicted esterase